MARTRLLVLTSLAMLAGCAAHPGGPRPRDIWHAYLYKGQRFGYQHTTVTRLPDGNFRYEVDTRALISLLGAKQELTRHAEYVVTPTYRPVSLRVEGEQLSGRTHCTGHVQDGKLVLTFTRAGMQQQRTLDLSGGAIPGVCVDDWLGDLPAATEAASVKLVTDELWDVVEAKMTRLARDGTRSAWNVDMSDVGQGTVWYDRKGVMVETKLTVPRMHLKRCTEGEAKDIDYLAASGRYVLSFPVGKQIPPPERLKAITVKLTWKDIPLEKFHLEDCRQRIVRKSQEAGLYEVALEITRPKPVTAEARYPIREEGFAQYLRATRFIKPRHEAIAAAAREAVEGTETAMEAVKALSEWVFKHIKASFIAETLTGPEVLECRQGKCAEYTTLFASMARCVGIPTRIALGVRMAGSIWAGHVWNEVYVGRWIPVDAAANEVGESFALVKFTHSDTLLGTQALRWALTDSLDIAVEDFQVRPSPLAEKYETGILGRVYTNTDYACRITAPDENWRIEDKSTGAAVIIRLKNPKIGAAIYFVAFSLPAVAEPKALIAARLGFIKMQVEDFQLLEDQPCKVGGAAGHTCRFSHRSKRDKQKKIVTTEVLWSRGPFGYLLKLTGQESAHGKATSHFQELLKSFEYLGEK